MEPIPQGCGVGPVRLGRYSVPAGHIELSDKPLRGLRQVHRHRRAGIWSTPTLGSPRRFCTPACRQAAHRRRRLGAPEDTPRQPTGGRSRHLTQPPPPPTPLNPPEARGLPVATSG